MHHQAYTTLQCLVFSCLLHQTDRQTHTHTHTGSRQTEEGALMEAEDQIYVNIEELGECHTKQKQPRHTETKPVRTASVARGETETCSSFKVATVCLALLCFLLLMTVVGVGVQYGRDFNQLSRDLANHTAEKDQLLARYQNLTDERDRLQTSLNSALFELSNMKKSIGTCPQGWRHSGSSCYFFYTTLSTWDSSRHACLSKQADLVIIDNQGEMEFLNNLRAYSKFWIGLRKTSTQSDWMWTDNRPLRTA
uniref:oxidized low-density lipoprotein receptor 1-like n=1 Tax=Scatophagus argus TaxID=75038 RepID=UPI001ED7E1C2|nr:oxidized low-density lipoprotein receptor 1-like [Scatophagus argus]